MRKTYLIIAIIAIVIFTGCNQTFLICKNDKSFDTPEKFFAYIDTALPADLAGTGTTTVVDDGMAGTGNTTVIDDGMAGTGNTTIIDNNMAGTGNTTIIENPITGTGSTKIIDDGIAGTAQVTPITEPVKVEPVKVEPVKVEPVKVQPIAPTAGPIKLAYDISDDYYTPEGEKFTNAEIMIDNKVVEEGSIILPGPHSVKITRLGYKDFQGSINVPVKNEDDTYILKAQMVSLPRAVKTVVRYDIYPNPEQDKKLGPCQIFLMGSTDRRMQEVKDGTMVKPDRYNIIAQRKGYNEFRGRANNIIPGVTPVEIPISFQAKNRVVQTEITYDIQPSTQLLQDLVISFIDFNKVPKNVKPNGMIPPGKYNYEVVHPAYKMEGNPETIDIQPDEEPFVVKANMIAQPRQIVFDAEHNNIIIAPTQILVDGEEIDNTKLYEPGTHHFVITFDKFETIDQDYEILPGSGTFRIKLDLIPKN